jgi:hypothetical protein
MTNAAKEWIEVGNFDSVTVASRCICEIEDRDGDAYGLFLEFYVETGSGAPTRKAFRVFHYPANVGFTALNAPDRMDGGYLLLDFTRQ